MLPLNTVRRPSPTTSARPRSHGPARGRAFRGRALRGAAAAVAATIVLGCVRGPFARDIAAERWSDARSAFDADSSLMNDDWALLQAAKLYSSPGRGKADLGRARMLLQRLLARNPQSRYRADAADRLAMVEAVIHERDSVATERRALDERIASLTASTRRLRASLDSATTRNDSLQRSVVKLEADLKDREDQLRALRLELARLKEIDLNPRPPGRPPR